MSVDKVAHECKNCMYCTFDQPEQDSRNGKCHRYPPQLYGNTATHPTVYIHSFCGEFKSHRF